MNTILLEDVFCDSGVPQYTFVEPAEYIKTKVALRTRGRGVIVEGPSGIGKTTCIKKALAEIQQPYLCAFYAHSRSSFILCPMGFPPKKMKNTAAAVIMNTIRQASSPE